MRSKTAAGAGTGALMVSGALFSSQLPGVVTVKLTNHIGAEELTWLRLLWGSVILVALARSWRHSFTSRALLTCACLGVASAGVTVLYMVSITRLPLGTATAMQFLGPLSVTVIRAPGAAKWLAIIPATGVVALTEPWRGDIDLLGILLAFGSGLFFAIYIELTQRAGDEIVGLHALAISVPVSAIVATFTVDFSTVQQISTEMLLAGLGVAVLLPVIPYILEFWALRRLTSSAFGTLLGLQPAVALAVGFVFLGQIPGVLPILGILLVVAASIAATLTGSRQGPSYISNTATRDPVND